MSQPPTDPPSSPRPVNPARVMLNSPLAAATRGRVYRLRRQQRQREPGLHIIGMAGTLLLHLLFLLVFVVGPAFDPLPPPEPTREFLQLRLVEPPEPPPPPPVRGTPPKELGPRHQARAQRAAPTSERSANVQSAVSAAPAEAAAAPAVAEAMPAEAPTPTPTPEPAAAPPPPVSLPEPAPMPDLQAITMADEPPVVTLDTPVVQVPQPPKFQPESMRPPQEEGTRPMVTTPSLAMPDVPSQPAPPITISSIALSTEVPKTAAPVTITPVAVERPAAPPVPELQAVPLPAQARPEVNLQTSPNIPAPPLPRQQPQFQAPAIELAEAELEAVPLAPAPATLIDKSAPAVKIEVSDRMPHMTIEASIERPQLSEPELSPASAASAAAKADAIAASSPTAASAQPDESTAASDAANAPTDDDISRSPDATPQGSDVGDAGIPDGVVKAPVDAASGATLSASEPARGKVPGGAGRQPGDTANAGGDAAGQSPGELGSYVQLKPRGDTQIMSHRTPNIGYQPTRFEQDWAPEGESALDTALRRAVEKTSGSHTFHLPRGIRIECTVMPLMPINLFGCRNPDPPAKPLDAEIYQRLNLAPANPVAAPASSSAPVRAPMIKVDNRAQCAAARVTGGPPPPGCEGPVLPVRPAIPASSSSSWVPASDQFQ